MKRMILTAAAVLSLGGAMAACETATPYQPLRAGSEQSGGYSEVKLETDRWRVTFQGNSLTSRETVESYLLYRAAELSVAQGYDWFAAIDRNTDKHVETYSTGPDPFYGPYGFGWRPYWRHYGGGFGWRGWDPYMGDPFFDIQTTEKYEASAEIVMGHGPKPADDHKAFDARAVIANLGPQVARPK